MDIVTKTLEAVRRQTHEGSKTQESTGEYLDDSMITSTVKAKLLGDMEVSGLAIDVATFKGIVQLSGFAKTEAVRQKAGQPARGHGSQRPQERTSGSSEARACRA